jgi:hypothetical protein
MSNPRPTDGMNAAEIRAKFTPIQICNEMIEDEAGWLGANTAVKQAWTSLTAAQQTEALHALGLYHTAKVADWRQRNGYPPL